MTVLSVRTRGPSRPRRTSGPGPGPSIPVETSDGAFGRSPAHYDNPADAIRASGLLGTEIRYIPHPSFDDPGARDAILAPMPPPDVTQAPQRPKAPAGLSPYLATLYHDGAMLLSRDQEAHLFRQMNYLKCLAEQMRSRLDPDRPRRDDMEEFERLRDAAVAVKQQIIRANLRLVVSIARRSVGYHGDLAELISIGNLSLIRSVDRFDFARGNKFSTYATWAIKNDLFSTVRLDVLARERLVPGHPAFFLDAADTRADSAAQLRAQDQRERVVARLLGRLNERERRIISGRFGIGGAPEETLQQIGLEMGITKERVRQLETRARARLRKLARAEELELLQA